MGITETQLVEALVVCYREKWALADRYPELASAWNRLTPEDKSRLTHVAREQMRPKTKLEEFFYEVLPVMSRLSAEDNREFALHSWKLGDGSAAVAVMYFENTPENVKIIIDAIIAAGEQLVVENKGNSETERRDTGG